MNLKISQPDSGYRINQDSFLLAEFVKFKSSDRIIDLGTGVGIIPVLLGLRGKYKEMIGLELQPELARFARQNVASNHLGNKIKIFEADIKRIKSLFSANSFDVVVSNPPYIPVNKGRLSPDLSKRMAKQESNCTIADIVAASRYLLKNKGKLYLSYLPDNLLNLLFLLREANLEPKQLRFSFSNPKSLANLILIEAIKNANPGLTVEII
ncbi:MAG: tRNA1(Val) (adenine(37)-N6)-methyltransferase [bacterium]